MKFFSTIIFNFFCFVAVFSQSINGFVFTENNEPIHEAIVFLENDGSSVLTAKDGRDRNLKLNLCTDILKSVGLIPNTNNNFITVLEKVNIGGEKFFINNLVEH